MQKHEIEMWETNIQNAASRVAAEYATVVENSVFARNDATRIHNIASTYNSEVFADLEQIANDN